MFLQRAVAGAGLSAVMAGLPRIRAEHANVQRKRWKIGHHFWNWDHAWNRAPFFERRLQLTEETGYAGFEAKPAEIGYPGKVVREKCAPSAVETREDLLRYLDERPGVFACPDTGHLALCGSDPVQTIRDLGNRCRYLHLKDLPASRVGNRSALGEKFCELGPGALDLPGVLQAFEDIRYEGWIMVERDSREPDYVQSAKNMRAVLQRLGC